MRDTSITEMLFHANRVMGLIGFAHPLDQVREDTDGHIFMMFFGEWAYLGPSEAHALVTAERGDWWIVSRDGELDQAARIHFVNRLKDSVCLDEKSSWANLYHDNVRRAQRARSLVQPAFRTKGSDMDHGEEIEIGDYEAVLKASQAPSIPITRIHLYRLKKSKTAWFFFKHEAVLPGLFTYDDDKKQWKSVQICITPDSYTLTYGTPFQSEAISDVCGLVVINQETNDLLNFEIINSHRQLMIRFVGNGHGQIRLHEFNTEIPPREFLISPE